MNNKLIDKYVTKDSIEKAIGKILYNTAKKDFLKSIKNNGCSEISPFFTQPIETE